MKKILEKSGNFVSSEKWEPCQTIGDIPFLFQNTVSLTAEDIYLWRQVGHSDKYQVQVGHG